MGGSFPRQQEKHNKYVVSPGVTMHSQCRRSNVSTMSNASAAIALEA
jgi:hypothetical protein